MRESKPVPPGLSPVAGNLLTTELHAAFLASHGGERACQVFPRSSPGPAITRLRSLGPLLADRCIRGGFSTRFIWSLIFVSELRRRQFMKKRTIAVRVVATPAHLHGLIEEATVDCHDDNGGARAPRASMPSTPWAGPCTSCAMQGWSRRSRYQRRN